MTNNKSRKRKLTIKWTTEQTVQLITEVESRQSLWNNALQHYNNRRVRDMLWEEIAEKLELEKSEVVNKWNSIRNTFRMSLSKWKSSNTLEDFSVKAQNNEIFKKLRFLEQTLRFDENKPTIGDSLIDNSCTDTDAEDAVIKNEDLDSVSSQHSFNENLARRNQRVLPNVERSSVLQPGTEEGFPDEQLIATNQMRSIDKSRRQEKPLFSLRLKTNPFSPYAQQIESQNQEQLEHKIEPMSEESERKANMSDEWAEVGRFIAMNGRRWSNNNPQRAAKFRSALYKLLYETDLEEFKANSFV